MSLTRRRVLQIAGAATAAGAGGLFVPLSRVASAESTLASANRPVPYRSAFRRPPVLQPYWRGTGPEGRPLHKYVVTQTAGRAQILPGLETPVVGYNGLFPGPTIRVPQGTEVEVAMRNRITVDNPFTRRPFTTVTHLHGSASRPQYDGYANDSIPPGHVKTYRYPNWQRARTCWYHDHNAHTSAENAYAGLLAQYQITDEAEQRQLPQGEVDVPVMITDAVFAEDGRLVFDDSGHDGVWGDVVLVNGVPWPTLDVTPRVYRLRLLNASAARSYRPRLSPDLGMTIVASDAGLFPRPQRVSSFRMSNGERFEVLVDFRGLAEGTLVEMRNLSNKNNDDYPNTNKIMRFRVVRDTGPADGYRIPTELDRGPTPDDHPAVVDLMSVTPEQIRRLGVSERLELDRSNGLWQINESTWADVEQSRFRDLVARVEPYELAVWEVENGGGGWFHPFHLHLADVRVVGRNTNGGRPFPWELGLKDTIYLGENEVVRLLVQFDLGPGNAGGKYMIHCHNLSHEDHDMMVQYAIGDPDVNDPIASDPAVADPPTRTWPAPTYA